MQQYFLHSCRGIGVATALFSGHNCLLPELEKPFSYLEDEACEVFEMSLLAGIVACIALCSNIY